VIGGGFTALALAAIALSGMGRGAAENGNAESVARNTIAVLPFTDVGGSTDSAYFGEGLADEILNRLSAVDGLQVVARTSSFAARASTDDVRTIGQRLSVAHVLEGTVRRDGDRVRIGVQLVDAGHGYRVWSARYDGVLGDIFTLQDEIANTIVAKLRDTVQADLPAIPIATSAPTTNLDAYQLPLRGPAKLNRRDEESLRRSMLLFQQAIELDPRYGQAYVELAKAYVLPPSYSAEIQTRCSIWRSRRFAAGVEHDAAIDDSMVVVLALVAYARWDWISAEVAFRRALEHGPNDPGPARLVLVLLAAVGRTADAAEQAPRARARSLSFIANHRPIRGVDVGSTPTTRRRVIRKSPRSSAWDRRPTLTSC
jgi:TolB-like protein